MLAFAALAALAVASGRRRRRPPCLRADSFRVSRVLGGGGSLRVVGRFAGDAADSLMVVGAKPFAAGEAEAQAAVRALQLRQVHANDVYSFHDGSGGGLPWADVTVMRPASAKHIAKHAPQRRVVVAETAADYEAVVRPMLEAQDPARLQWVRNILSGEAEADVVLLAAPGFVLLPDTKWVGGDGDVGQLYCLAIARDGALRSMRDLRGRHLPLLRELRDASLRELERRFAVPPAALRVFLHYHPSYYHLHVHFAHVGCTKAGVDVGRAVLLDDVIDWLARDPEHFATATLRYVAGERTHGEIVEAYAGAGVSLFS